MLHKQEIQKKIKLWCENRAKQFDSRALFEFKDIDKKNFSFTYYGYLYTILCYNEETNLKDVLVNTGWKFSYKDAGTIIIGRIA